MSHWRTSATASRSRTGATQSQFLQFVVLAYICFQPLIPKVYLGPLPVHPAELLFVIVVFLELARGRGVVRPALELTPLLGLIFLSLATSVLGPISTGGRVVVAEPVLLSLKYLIPFAIFLLSWDTLPDPMLVFRASTFALVIQIAIPVGSTILDPVTGVNLLYEYGYRYRAIGLSGYAIGAGGLQLVGTTSVQMGAYFSLYAFLSVSLYAQKNRLRYVLIAAVLMIGLLLTFSRTGLFVLALGMPLIIASQRRQLRRLIAVGISLGSVAALVFGPAIWQVLLAYTSLGRIFGARGLRDTSTTIRLDRIQYAVEELSQHPLYLITGSGYGEAYTSSLTPFTHFESFLITSLYQSGFLSILLVFAFFGLLWWRVPRRGDSSTIDSWSSAAQISILAFSIGWFFSLTFSGNLLQTDFLAPAVVYWLLVSKANRREWMLD